MDFLILTENHRGFQKSDGRGPLKDLPTSEPSVILALSQKSQQNVKQLHCNLPPFVNNIQRAMEGRESSRAERLLGVGARSLFFPGLPVSACCSPFLALSCTPHVRSFILFVVYHLDPPRASLATGLTGLILPVWHQRPQKEVEDGGCHCQQRKFFAHDGCS
jgi:hypothetical protein